MPKLTVIYKDLKVLKPREKNPRKHPKRQIGQLKRSITEFCAKHIALLRAADVPLGLDRTRKTELDWRCNDYLPTQQ